MPAFDSGGGSHSSDGGGQRDMLLHLCAANGIKEEDLKRPETVTSIEMVLDDYCDMRTLGNFPKLKSVCLIQQAIQKIDGLDRCTELERLLLNENSIEKLDGLQHCKALKKLYLSSNCIKEIGRGLSGLAQLEVFWIADNQLENLDGIAAAPSLTELNAASNRITSVIGAFSQTPKLRSLNLSGNRICSFREVLDLSRLRKLQELHFADPDWGENPICLLCNYQTYALYHLPMLQVHDCMHVGQEEHAAAEAAFSKKRLYYNMRIKMLKRQAGDAIRAAKVIDEERRSFLARDLEAAARTLKRAEAFQRSRSQNAPDVGPHQDEDASERQDLQAVQQQLQLCQVELADTDVAWDNFTASIESDRDAHIRALLLELQTGGNVRLEPGVPDQDPWASQIRDLVQSRFRAEDFARFGFVDLKVQQVTRIHHRSMKIRCDELLDSIDADGGSRHLDHLFYVPDSRQTSEDLRAMTEVGPVELLTQEPSYPAPRISRSCGDVDAQEEGSKEDAESSHDLADRRMRRVLLTNSVALAEGGRLQHSSSTELGQAVARASQRAARLLRAPGSGAIGEDQALVSLARPAPSCSGTLLVCSVHLGEQVAERSFDAGVQDVHEFWDGALAEQSVPGFLPTSQDSPGVVRSYFRSRMGDPKQKIWHTPHAELVLPEFLVDFDYVHTSQAGKEKETKPTSKSEFGPFAGMLRQYSFFARLGEEDSSSNENKQKPSGQQLSQTPVQADAAESRATHWPVSLPELPSIERLEPQMWSEPVFEALSLPQPSSLPGLKVLNLHGRNLRRLDAEALKPLVSLHTLLLSFNTIESVSAVPPCPSLVVLDLSHNLIQKISSLSGYPALRELDVSWNQLLSLETFDLLQRDVPRLEKLAFAGNPAARERSCRRLAIVRLPCLRVLDDNDISKEEAAQARSTERNFSEIPEDLLMKHSFVPSLGNHCSDNFVKRPALPGALGYDPERDCVSAHLGSDLSSSDWRAKVEQIDLRRMGLTGTSGLGYFPKCQSLRLCNNCLTSLEGLPDLPCLEEFAAERNSLCSLKGLSKFQELQRLDVGGNHLTDVLDLSKLSKLSQLSLEDNFVDSLDTFAQLHSLMELYLSNNVIEELRAVLLLKQLPKLIILDLSGNDLCSATDYRHYTIFHLRRLKVLDGAPVSQAEQQEADGKFSGKVTMELLEDKLGPSPSCYNFRTVDLSNQGLRELGQLINDEIFPSLRELILDGNPFSDIRNVGPLSKLLVLRMNKTKIDLENGMVGKAEHAGGIATMGSLQVLEMGQSGITDISFFAQFPLHGLRILHLPGNEITKIEGLNHLDQLRELVIDKNKVKMIDEKSFEGLKALRELRAEDNGLKSLSNLSPLPRLRALYLSLNRVAELCELDKLRHLKHLLVIHLSQNPVARKPLYRSQLIGAVSNVRAVDGREVTEEERERVEQMLAISEGAKAGSVYIFNDPQPQSVQLSYMAPPSSGVLGAAGDPSKGSAQAATESVGRATAEPGRRATNIAMEFEGPGGSGKKPQHEHRAQSAPRRQSFDGRYPGMPPGTGR
eukprot:TRINITY_DN39743_c0_g1_i1.p1 TRINITY_DN39743_c0_g1~~TRINITY_DN39743_c0_g1_i1.p1  ORF type:complete len:1541 (+),score=395.74 TRINITY_DN39743_c0_g1_i1:64-4686(+)